MISRRSSLQILGGSVAGLVLPARADDSFLYPIGVCDWNLKMKQDIGAFDVGAEIGVAGLQVSFSTPGSDFDLRDRRVREKYYRRADETGIRIASLGMGILNQKALATNPESIEWVGDAIETMATIAKEQPDKAITTCLLAFFGKGDINGRPELIDIVIEKLKTVAKQAEDAGVVLGIESLLSAEDHLAIIDGVGSRAIEVYYDSANSLEMGYDIYEEVVRLGAGRICQIHCKEKGNLIGKGEVDFVKFRDALAKAGYRDWLIMEASRPKEMDLVEAYAQNLATLNSIFNA